MKSLAIEWSLTRRPHLSILDQQLLPQVEKWIPIHDVDEMIFAIQTLQVRGAPLIGVAAALSLAQSALFGANLETFNREADELVDARPTAVNLKNCVERLKKSFAAETAKEFNSESVLKLALEIANEDIELCEKMAIHGASLIQDGDQILTHCNTGSLATAGIGTALGVIRKAHEQGRKIHVYVDETRPLLQGGRLTTWELEKLKIPYTLITDSTAAHLMSMGKIHKVFLGCDRIAANGDFANKIGTYNVAVIAHFHRIPFYVVGPQTTVDRNCPSGIEIPIERRAHEEVRGAKGSFGKVIWSPEHSPVYNPSFDVTPAGLVTSWILDTGIYNQKDILAGVFK